MNILSAFFSLILLLSACSIHDRIEISLLKKSNVFELELSSAEATNYLVAHANIELKEGSSLKHRIIRISNAQKSPLHFMQSDGANFQKLINLTPLSLYKKGRHLESLGQKMASIKKSNYAVELAKHAGIFRINLHLIDLAPLGENESIELEVEFEHPGPHQINLSIFDPSTVDEEGVQCIQSPIFSIG